jgi:hypothetical protein
MDGLSYSRSVAQYAEQSYQSELERFNQEKQIATAHFEADKKDIVEPVSFVSGGILSAGVGGLGKKLAAKTGIKAFENIGKESLSTTLRNVAGEAVAKGKDQVGVLKDQLNTVLGKAGEQSDATKKLINDTLTKNGFEPLSEADFANPSALGDKMLKQSTTKVSQTVSDVAGDASSKVSNAVGDVDQAVKDAKGAVSSTVSDAKGAVSTVSDLSSDTGTNLSKTFMTHLNSTDLPTSLNFIKDPVTLDSIKTQSNVVRGVFDNTSASAEFGDETGSASLQAPKTIEQSGGNTPAPDQSKQPTNLSEDSPDRVTPTEDEPEPPVEEPDVPDVPLAPEGDVEDAGNVLSKLSDIIGTADVATGGLDIAGDVLEGAIGVAGLFLPGLLDKQKEAPAIPKNNFVTSYSAGTGIV